MSEMPRYVLSANQTYFDTLFSLLDRNDESTPEVWDLVRMLNTNKQTFMQVLSLQASADKGIDWSKVFEDDSLYKQIYKQEIIMAVMEEDQEGMDQRVVITDCVDETLDFLPEVEEEKKADEQEAQDLKSLKVKWSEHFVTDGGITFAVEKLLNRGIPQVDQLTMADLKDIAFFVTLTKVFITGALSAKGSGVSSAMSIVRKQSSIKDDGAAAPQEEEEKAEQKKEVDFMEKLMKEGNAAEEIILNTDFEALSVKLLELIAAMSSSQNITAEHKVVVEASLGLVVAAMINDPEMFQTLVSFKSQAVPEIASGKDLILTGLLYCPEDKIRKDFKNTLKALCQQLNKGTNNALAFVLTLLGQNFSEISNRPCAEFFDLFNALIDLKAQRDEFAGQLADAEEEKIQYDPEDLLTQIIARLKESQQLSKQKKSDDDDDEDEKDEDQAAE